MKIVIEIPGDPSATTAANCVRLVAGQVAQDWDHGLVKTFDGLRADWKIEETK